MGREPIVIIFRGDRAFKELRSDSDYLESTRGRSGTLLASHQENAFSFSVAQ